MWIVKSKRHVVAVGDLDATEAAISHVRSLLLSGSAPPSWRWPVAIRGERGETGYTDKGCGASVLVYAFVQ
jgi:hypothetical protein